MVKARPWVTFTTDFGLSDYYVPAMKAVVLSVREDLRLFDLTHDLQPQDLLGAAWVLKNSAFLFPEGTVHMAVVDPGVGTDRKAVVVYDRGQYFVGPDNGMFTLVTAGGNPVIRELNNPRFWRCADPSPTFHGRDIFAPVAAHLASGADFEELGTPLLQLQDYRWAQATTDRHGIHGWVVHTDRFGNLITNITRAQIEALQTTDPLRIYVGTHILRGIMRTYATVPDGEPLAIIGSSDVLEIAVNKGNASELLGVPQGAQVSVLYGK